MLQTNQAKKKKSLKCTSSRNKILSIFLYGPFERRFMIQMLSLSSGKRWRKLHKHFISGQEDLKHSSYSRDETWGHRNCTWFTSPQRTLILLCGKSLSSSLSATDVWGCVTLWWGASCALWGVEQLPWSPPTTCQELPLPYSCHSQNVSRHCQVSLGRQNNPRVVNHDSRDMRPIHKRTGNRKHWS